MRRARSAVRRRLFLADDLEMGRRRLGFRSAFASRHRFALLRIKTWGLSATGLGGRRQQRGGELFVEAEEVFDALAVGVEGFGAVALLDGAIEFGVGLGEVAAGMESGS